MAAPPPGRDPRLDEVEQIIADPAKRLKALADRKIPRYAKEYDADTPEVRFLSDLESGTRKAKEYVEFIQKASDYAQQFGDLTQSEHIKTAAAGLKRVTSGVLGGIGGFAKVVSKAKELVTFYQAADAFADASRDLDFNKRDSVTAWATSIKTLWNAGGPFVDWVKSKALSAAFAGSKLAGVASATLSIVGAQIFIAIEALNVGVANVNLYIEKMQQRMRQIELQSGQRPHPPKPVPPAEWKSRGEEAYEARERENTALREQVRQQIDAEKAAARQKAEAERKAQEEKIKADEEKKKAEKKAQEEAARRAAAQVEADFRDAYFPGLWIRTLRAPLVAKLRRDLLRQIRASGTGDSHENRCYECFESSGDEDTGNEIYIPKVSRTVGADGAKREIARFTALGSCDDFTKASAAARKAFDAKRASPSK